MLQRKARQTFHLISNANTGGLLNIGSLIPVGENKGGIIQWKTTRELPKEKHPQDRQMKFLFERIGGAITQKYAQIIWVPFHLACARRRQPNPDPNCGFTISHKMKYLRF